MNKTLSEGISFIGELKAALAGKSLHCDVIIGAPFIHLASIAKEAEGSPIAIAAENCADKAEGAYTGEVSAAQVASTGARYVILGHSERRAYYHEDGAILTDKVRLALAEGLAPIFCIGEVKEEREAGKHFEVVEQQLEEAVFSLSAEDFGKIVLAYEPSGLSVRASLLPLLRLRRSTLTSVASSLRSTVLRSQKTARSSMVVAAMLLTLRSSSLSPTSTVVSSVALHSA